MDPSSSSAASQHGVDGTITTSSTVYTYEAKKALEYNSRQADKVHWERSHAYRNQNYRQLFHQNNLIGTFEVRLLEAADLKRSYWSALALGPMKHLGLSKAHGNISSYVSFGLDNTSTSASSSSTMDDDLDRKMPAKNKDNNNSQNTIHPILNQQPIYVSPVKSQDNNPVWTNCSFDLPLQKGQFDDGQTIKIFVRVDEDAGLENFIPIAGHKGQNARLLGIGTVDVTSLCLGQLPATGRPSSGVIDAWIPIRLPKMDQDEQLLYTSRDEQEFLYRNAQAGNDLKKMAKKKAEEDESNKIMGKVRILISYHPHGLQPQPHDIVALEAFARQNPFKATCLSILPSLQPLHVLEVSDPWLLVEYQLPFVANGRPNNYERDNNDNKACMRIHRNAVFVIERKNLLDATLNLALQPADFVLATPIGQGAQEMFGPLFVAGKHLLMPALLSSKLVWMAIRTTALASLSGVTAAGSAFVHEGTTSLTNDGNRRRQQQQQQRTKKYISL